VIVYVDDCLLFSPSDEILDDMLVLLNKTFKITSSNSIKNYLGLEVTRSQEENTITLKQTGLIDKVIQICGLEEESNKHLTASDKILHQSDGTDAPQTTQMVISPGNWNLELHRSFIKTRHHIHCPSMHQI